ncbi:MAG TPA: AAA family ATPase [Hyphomicrobiaceae bacterium]|nr:AAA family ATPase [Hyphomicrobiaceae bacterium]
MSTHFPNLAGTPATGHTVNGATPPHGPWQYAHLIRKPGDPIVRQRFEFRALSLTVREHLVNQIAEATRNDAARMLWVQGRPGEGKSLGCLVACLNAGFHTAVLSPGLFAGDVEGASVQALHDVLTELVAWSAAHRCRVVVIIDDFDLSTANVGENQGSTVNSQLLVNEFMALADNRHLYRNVDGSNIGFICTVNDATGMRESLHRPGRAIWHDHVPSAEDKANIAWSALDPKTTPERELVAALVRKHAAQPVAFWNALHHRMRALHAKKLIDTGMPDKAAVDAAHGHRLPLVSAIAWEAAKQIRTSRVRSYLGKRRWWRR